MKNLNRLLLTAALVLGCMGASAQKFAYINSQRLIESMPERDSAIVKLQNYQKELSDQMELIQVEFNNKLNEYQKIGATASDAVKQLKEKELRDLQTRFSEFQETADQDMQRMQGELMQPVITKAQEAIKKVGKAGGFLAVFDEAAGALVYHDEVAMVNLLPAVLKELGITEKPAATPSK